MGKQIEFFYDYLSPFSYLADTQLPAIARRTGAEIVYRPVLLGAIMKATGNSGPLPIQGKAGYNVADFQRWAKKRKFLDAEVESGRFWDPRFTDEANRILAASEKRSDGL